MTPRAVIKYKVFTDHRIFIFNIICFYEMFYCNFLLLNILKNCFFFAIIVNEVKRSLTR